MQIAVSEPFPLLENLLRKNLRNKPYCQNLCIQPAKNCTAPVALFLSDETTFPGRFFVEAELVILQSAVALPKNAEAFPFLCAGMGLSDSLTLSSIRETEAMLCLQKEVRFGDLVLEPLEEKIPFDPNFSIYKNIAAGFVGVLLDRFYEEETKWMANRSFP